MSSSPGTMARRWVWVVAVPFAVAALLFASTFIVGHQAEEDDSAVVEAKAMAALGTKVGDCTAGTQPFYVQLEPAEIDAKTRDVSGPGWVGTGFIGKAEELAASRDASIVASGKGTIWTLENTEAGERMIVEYARIDLPSGRVVWRMEQAISTAPCENVNPPD